MSNYTPIVSYGPKDALSVGDPAKRIKGVEVGAEFTSIATMSTTKYQSGDTIVAAIGSAATPSYTFTGDTNTGMSAASADTLVLSTAGVARITQSTALTTLQTNARISNTLVQLQLEETDAAADEKVWEFRASGGDFFLYTSNDGYSAVGTPMTITRTGTTVDEIELNATLLDFNGVLDVSSTIELGHATDTTLSRVSAGVVGVEGVALATKVSGTFTGTITGCTTSPTGNVDYTIINNICHLKFRGGILGTSNTTALTMTGLPAACQPTTTCQIASVDVADSATGKIGSIFINGGTGTLTFSLYTVSGSHIVPNSAAFTASGTKGIVNGTSITYGLA